MTYAQSIEYLLSFTNLELKPGQSLTKKDFNLENITKLLQLLGNPHYLFKSVHIAGSKGKGSTAALIELGIRSAGKKTGLFTSPHLIDFTERFCIDGNPVSEVELAEAIAYLKPFISKVSGIQTFEIMTALAFHLFAAHHVDWAIVEVGLGGRLDATNVLMPEIAVITPIYKEHTYILGDTIEEIAHEKAGIIKPSVSVVVSFQPHGEARESILNAAQKRIAPIIQAEEDISLTKVKRKGRLQRFEYKYDNKKVQIDTPLLGDHQLINIQAAFSVLKTLGVSHIYHKMAAENVAWPGRFQIVTSDQQTYIFDVAHIPEAMQYVVDTYQAYFDKKAVVVFGVSGDKHVKKMIEILNPITDTYVLTKSSHPRSMSTQEVFNAMDGNEIETIPTDSLKDAFDIVAVKNAEIILVTGSFFVVGDAMQAISAIEQNQKVA